MKVDIVKIRVDDTLGTVTKMAPDVYRVGSMKPTNEGPYRGARVLSCRRKAVLDAGADFIAHSVRDADVDDAMIAAMKKRDVCLSPTLMREARLRLRIHTAAFFGPLFLAHADARRRGAERGASRRAAHQSRAQRSGRTRGRQPNLKSCGCRHPDRDGHGHGAPARFQATGAAELEMMVKAGLTPRQASRQPRATPHAA